MIDLDFCTPTDIPAEFLEFSQNLSTLNVGTSGKTGVLRLVLEKDRTKNKTIVTEQYSQVPLFTQRALHYDTANPAMAYLFIMSSGGGILQGDRYRTDLVLRNNAIANITTQGATRIYKMDSNYATQLLNIEVAENCYLEFIPDQIIPYKNSRYYQKVNIVSHDSATVVYSEVVSPGRVAMGELFSYDICYLRTIGKNPQGEIKFIDSSLLSPKKQQFSSLGVLEGHTMFGTVYIVTKNHIEKIQEEISDFFDNNGQVVGGCSFLPENSGITVRIVGNCFEEIKTTIYEVIRIVRKQILNSTFEGIRKT